jgi:hypothetical protein
MKHRRLRLALAECYGPPLVGRDLPVGATGFMVGDMSSLLALQCHQLPSALRDGISVVKRVHW